VCECIINFQIASFDSGLILTFAPADVDTGQKIIQLFNGLGPSRMVTLTVTRKPNDEEFTAPLKSLDVVGQEEANIAPVLDNPCMCQFGGECICSALAKKKKRENSTSSKRPETAMSASNQVFLKSGGCCSVETPESSCGNCGSDCNGCGFGVCSCSSECGCKSVATMVPNFSHLSSMPSVAHVPSNYPFDVPFEPMLDSINSNLSTIPFATSTIPVQAWLPAEEHFRLAQQHMEAAMALHTAPYINQVPSTPSTDQTVKECTCGCHVTNQDCSSCAILMCHYSMLIPEANEKELRDELFNDWAKE
jgi:hypothetical protein